MLSSVCSSIKPLIKDALSAKIGICAREIELVNISTGKPALEKVRNVAIDDRFKLKIPISDQFMTWEVVFNCSQPNSPPDFDLNDPDFFSSVTLDSMEALLPSLVDWDHTKDNALINVISELRSAYLKYQVEKLETLDNRCTYDYGSLFKDHQMSDDYVEVFIEDNIVYFLVKLDVDLNFLLPSDVPVSDDCLMMMAVRCGAHGGIRSATLMTSPSVVQRVGTKLELHRNIDSDENLSEYVEEVSRSIENQVLEITKERQQQRKQFVFELLKHLGRSVLSYDALEYHDASFLLEQDGFVCILHVTLPLMFPSREPCYRLTSTYSTNQAGLPLSQKLELPYCDSWQIRTMVDQALALIRGKKIQLFKNTMMHMFQPLK